MQKNYLLLLLLGLSQLGFSQITPNNSNDVTDGLQANNPKLIITEDGPTQKGPVFAPETAPLFPPPSGVYCSCGPTTGNGSGSVAPNIAVKPFVKGILVRVGWQLLEPSEGQFNWSLLDGQISAARSYGKKISLGVGCGIAIPSWVFEAGAEKLITIQPFQDTIAMPWDGVFLDKWTTFIAALGNRYQNDSTIALVYMTHSTANGYEMQLPMVTNPTLAAAGYTDAKMISSWKTVANAFESAFPNHFLSNDFHPVNGSNAVADSVYAHAVQAIGDRYGASAWWWTQKNTTVYPAQYTLLQQSAQENLFTGIQMARNGTTDSIAFGPGGMPVALQLAIDKGICYWEVWNQDILNPDFTDLLSQADCAAISAIEPELMADRISIFPNPTHDILNLGTGEYSVQGLQLFNLQGQELMRKGLVSQLNMGQLSTGCYLLRIQINGRFYLKKVLKD